VQSVSLGVSKKKIPDVYKLDNLNTEALIVVDQRSPARPPRHEHRHFSDQTSFSGVVADHRSAVDISSERPSCTSIRDRVHEAQGVKFGASKKKTLDVYKLDSLNTHALIDADRCSPASPPCPKHQHLADQRSFSRVAAYHRSGSDVLSERPSYTSIRDGGYGTQGVIYGASRNEEFAMNDIDALIDGVHSTPASSPRLKQRHFADPDEGHSPQPCSTMLNTVYGSSESEPAACHMPDRGMRGERKCTTLDGARMKNENEIISAHATSESNNVAEAPRTCMMSWLRLPRLILALSGVLPCDVGMLQHCNGVFVLMFCFLTLAHFVYTLVARGVDILSLACACYALGGGLGLCALRQMSIRDVLEQLLEPHAIKHGFQEAWVMSSLRQVVLVSLFWMGAVVTLVLSFVFWPTAEGEETEGLNNRVPVTLCFIFASGVVAALTYCQLHVCAGLELMVDTFCTEFFEHADFAHGVAQWNLVQAIMRRSAQAVDLCFLSVQTSVLTATLLIGMQSLLGPGSRERAFHCLPSSLFMVAFMQYGQYRAAAVTERCSRAPALLNSFAVGGHEINFERQYLVQFILQSAAGFYVRGVRLTVFMMSKSTYLCVMAALGVAMRYSKSADCM